MLSVSDNFSASSAAPFFKDRDVFQPLDVADERIFILAGVLAGGSRPTTSLSLAPVHRFYLGHDKCRAILREIFCYSAAEFFFRANSAGLLNTTSFGYHLQIHSARRRCWHSRLVTTGAAGQIITIIKDDDEQVARLLIAHSPKTAQIQNKIAVRIQRNHPAMRQSQSHSQGGRRTHPQAD